MGWGGGKSVTLILASPSSVRFHDVSNFLFANESVFIRVVKSPGQYANDTFGHSSFRAQLIQSGA